MMRSADRNYLFRTSLLMTAILAVTVLTSCTPRTAPPLAPESGKAVTGPDPRTMKFPELEFDVPVPERIEMQNGMVVYLYEDRMIPVISVYALIRTGEIYEPADKAGLASLTGDVMRTGGTSKMTSREVDEKLEYIAARCDTSIARDSGSASLLVRTENFDEAMGIFADILRTPVFEQEKLDLQKQQLMEDFRRENDDPFTVLGREFRELLYKSHPYARKVAGYPDTITKITRDDLVAFHDKYFKPNNIILGVSGDFSRDEMVKKIEKYFGTWEKAEIGFPEVPAVDTNIKRQLAFVPKDLNQSTFFIGHVGVDRLNPDYFSILFMNYVLGGSGFNSRLMDTVRTKAGLAYDVGSFMQYSKYPGMFICYCATKTASTYDAAEKIISELQRIRQEEITDEEFQRARNAIRNQFVFMFDQSSEVVARYINLEFYGLPRDYLQKYLENVSKVTKKDVLEAARKYIHPDKATVLIIGKEAAIETFPKDFGEFKTIELKSEE